MQAGALYAMGDFEHALVSYHKANSEDSLLMKEKREIEVRKKLGGENIYNLH